MTSDLLQCLTGSKCRAAVLRELSLGWSGSVSELARRTRFSVRSVADEVARLEAARLVRVRGMGGANIVRLAEGRLARALTQLVDATEAEPAEQDDSVLVKESLAALGAPLHGIMPVQHFEPHEAVVRGVRLARRDGTVFRVLPVVLAKHEHDLDWVAARELAKREKLKAEFGVLVELTARAVNRPSLSARVSELRDRRRKVVRYFPELRSSFEKELAEQVTPPVAREWGFRMNVSEESLKSTLEKHGS